MNNDHLLFNADKKGFKYALPARYESPLRFHNLGCMHLDDAMASEDSVDKFIYLNKSRFLKDYDYAIITGDPFTALRRHDQHIIAEAEAKGVDTTNIHAMNMFVADRFHDKLKFMDGNVLFAVIGNHSDNIPENKAEGLFSMTLDEYFVRKFGGRFGGAVVYAKVILIFPDGWRPVIKIHASHNYRGGMTPGGALNAAVVPSNFFQAHIVISSHLHTPVFTAQGRLDYVGDKIKASPTMICRAGAFMLNYVEGKGNYATPMNRPPAALLMPNISVAGIKYKGKRHLMFEYHSGVAWERS